MMTIRERLKAKIDAGIREETCVIDGATVILRGTCDSRYMREAWLLDDDSADEGARELSKKLKSLYKLKGGVSGREYKESTLISMVAFDEKGVALDPLFVAALCRVDSIAYMALLSAAMRVTGLLDPVSVTAGNSPASAGGSGSSAA